MLLKRLFVVCVLLMHAHFLAAVDLSLPKSVDATKWSDVAKYLKRIKATPKEIERVRINRQNLTEIPSWIFEKMNHIQFLDLNHNAISEVPAGIGKLTKLKMLYLVYNNIHYVHPDIQKATKLEALDLGRNNLPKIPEGVYRLPELKDLRVFYNRIRGVSADIALLKKLKLLYLNGNPLKYLPKEIGELTALEELDLESTHLTGLPKEIEKLAPSLRDLYLAYVSLYAHSEGNLIGKGRIKEVFGRKAHC